MNRQAHPWAASDVIPMFPTLVWKLELQQALRQSIDAAVLATIEAGREGLPALAAGQAWQSRPTLHELDAFRDFVACVKDAGRLVLHFLRVGSDEIEVTGCWVNVLATGAGHRKHHHPNNFLSGVYYVRTGAGSNTIQFHEPRVQASVLRPPVSALTGENTDQVVVRVNDGTLLLFPSWFEHSVDANADARQRISVSFNLMFPSFAADLATPLW